MGRWRIILLAVCLSAHVSMAGWWSGNAWDEQRSGRDYATNSLAAITERFWASTSRSSPKSALPSVSFWRSQRANLSGIKTWIQGTLSGASPYWVDVTENNTSSYFEDWFEEYDGYYVHSAFPVLSVSNVLERANLPENYFTYTPWRCLNGLGGLTNDVTVGREHGWTNATTASGGINNFSAGRTNWYTTDYGWQGIKDICNQMIWVSRDASTFLSNKWESCRWEDYGPMEYTNSFAAIAAYGTNEPVWASARSGLGAFWGSDANGTDGEDAESDSVEIAWMYLRTTTNLSGVGSFGFVGGENHAKNANKIVCRFSTGYEMLGTNLSYEAQLYVVYVGPSGGYFDFLGVGGSNGCTRWIETIGTVSSTNVQSAAQGPSGGEAMMPSSFVNDYYGGKNLGQSIIVDAFLQKFDVEGGFDYKP